MNPGKTCLLMLICMLYSARQQELNLTPIVGIITIPSDIEEFPKDKWSYFPSSYVKFLESAGAQVIPIQYDLPREKVLSLLNKVNGVLLTGGGTVFVDDKGKKLPVAESFEFIVNYVIDQNMKGTFYPLWGTCQGFEVLAMILSKNYDLLTHCSKCIDVNKNNILEPTYNSKLFGGLSDDLKKKLENSNLSLFWEDWKVDIKPFQSNNLLSKFLTPVSYTYDAAGTKYVSSFEGPNIPIYATQFHQEISTYEWIDNHANHGEDAVLLQQHLSNFFVNEVRKNHNKFQGYEDYLIQNYKTTPNVDGFVSVYLFPAIKSTPEEEKSFIV